jgi:ParB-like chromosome segregation protein Spo0J
MRAEARARLLHAITKARRWVSQLITGDLTSTDQIAQRERCSERSVRMTLGLAFLSPEIVKAAIDGQLPRGLFLAKLAEGPTAWTKQRSSF